MSDDDREFIDVESEEDDDLRSTDGKGEPIQFANQADKRAHHNALERKRRDHIKESFNSLRDSVPNLCGEKASRAQILKKATDYISAMKGRNTKHQSDIDNMRHENRILEEQVDALEKIKSTNSFASSQDQDNEAASPEDEAPISKPPRRKKMKSS